MYETKINELAAYIAAKGATVPKSGGTNYTIEDIITGITNLKNLTPATRSCTINPSGMPVMGSYRTALEITAPNGTTKTISASGYSVSGTFYLDINGNIT